MTKLIPRVLDAGQGQAWNAFGDRLICKVQGADTGGAYSVVEGVTPAGNGPPLHVHHNEDELFYVIRGRFEFTIDDEKRIVSQGAVIAAPRDLKHSFRNIGSDEGRMLITFVPGGFEGFFREIAEFTAVKPPDMATVLSISKRYGLEFL